MKSSALTPAAYLASLPPDRREPIETVRRVILENLDRTPRGPDGNGGFEECMQYGVLAYCLPHSVWPHGHHTRPELPLMYMGLSSQKNDMVVYMLFLLHNKPEREWFEKAWSATGKKCHLEVSGAGCCLRFKKLEDLSFDVIARAIRRMPVQKYLDDHVAMLARLGRGPDGKPLKNSSGARSASAKAGPAPKSKAKKKSSNKKTAKKKAAKKKSAARRA